MLAVAEVGRPGWFRVPVVLVAEQPIDEERMRLKHDRLGAPQSETWRLRIDAGERLAMKLPKALEPRAGERIALSTVADFAPLRQRWVKVSSL